MLRSGAGVHIRDAVDHVLAVTTPWQCTQITLPMQFNTYTRALLQLTCHALASHRELQLIGLQVSALRRLKPSQNHLTLIGLKDKTLFLEIIDIAFIHALAIDKAEFKKDKSCYQERGRE